MFKGWIKNKLGNLIWAKDLKGEARGQDFLFQILGRFYLFFVSHFGIKCVYVFVIFQTSFFWKDWDFWKKSTNLLFNPRLFSVMFSFLPNCKLPAKNSSAAGRVCSKWHSLFQIIDPIIAAETLEPVKNWNFILDILLKLQFWMLIKHHSFYSILPIRC